MARFDRGSGSQKKTRKIIALDHDQLFPRTPPLILSTACKGKNQCDPVPPLIRTKCSKKCSNVRTDPVSFRNQGKMIHGIHPNLTSQAAGRGNCVCSPRLNDEKFSLAISYSFYFGVQWAYTKSFLPHVHKFAYS